MIPLWIIDSSPPKAVLNDYPLLKFDYGLQSKELQSANDGDQL